MLGTSKNTQVTLHLMVYFEFILNKRGETPRFVNVFIWCSCRKKEIFSIIDTRVILAASVFKLAVWKFMFIWTSFNAYGIILDHFLLSSKVQPAKVFLSKSFWPSLLLCLSNSVIRDRWTSATARQLLWYVWKQFTQKNASSKLSYASVLYFDWEKKTGRFKHQQHTTVL